MTDSVIGLDASNPNKKILINRKDQREQTYIIGTTRQGKSTLIENIVLEDIKNNLGVCLIDPHGDLTNNIISRMTKRLDEVVYIDLADRTYIAPFNLFYCENPNDEYEVENIVSAFLHILQSSFGISPDQHARIKNQYFRHLATLLVHNQNHTMLDILHLLANDEFMLQLVKNVPDYLEQSFWKDFYAKYSKGMRRMEDISMISNKIEEFISPVMRPWFGDTKKTIHFRKLMDEKKIVFIRSNPQWETITKIVGNVVIAQLLDAAYSRRNIPLNERKQMNVYVDEYQKFASEDFSKLFSEAAKYGLTMTVSSQVREQVEPDIKAVCDQAKNIIIFRVSPENAKELAKTFDCSPQPGLPRYEPLKTPVREPIQYMVTHGVHPLSATRNFISVYGRMLVDNAREEEDLERDDRRAEQNYQRDIAAAIAEREGFSEPFSRKVVARAIIPVTKYNRELLRLLNYIFHEAMMAGKEGKTLNDNIEGMPPSFADNLIEILKKEPERTYIRTRDKFNEFQLPFLLLPGHISEWPEDARLALQLGLHAEMPIGKLENLLANLSPHQKEEQIRIKKEIEFVKELQKYKPKYDAFAENFQKQVAEVMRELYVAPVEENSGLTQEVATELSSYEVELRIANELKQLPKYTAKARIASGEYTITTINPTGYISANQREKHITEIQERNRNAGYLRLRDEVKEEIRKRYEPVSPPTPQVGAINPPPPQQQQKVVSPTRKAAIGKQCSKCQANNAATSLFCSQCGTKLV